MLRSIHIAIDQRKIIKDKYVDMLTEVYRKNALYKKLLMTSNEANYNVAFAEEKGQELKILEDNVKRLLLLITVITKLLIMILYHD